MQAAAADLQGKKERGNNAQHSYWEFLQERSAPALAWSLRQRWKLPVQTWVTAKVVAVVHTG